MIKEDPECLHNYFVESKEELLAFIGYLQLTNCNIWEKCNTTDTALNLNHWNLDILYFGAFNNFEVIEEFNNWYNNNDNQLRCKGIGSSDSGISESMPSPEAGASGGT